MRIQRRTIVLGALAAAATIAVVGLIKILTANPDMFGKDLPAYVEAARRLIETGTPYSQQIHLGQLDRYDIATGYLYPPLLAQLFVPLLFVPMPLLPAVWALAQVVLLIAVLTMVYVRFGGVSDRPHIAAILLAAVAFYPNLMAIVVGNVSGWIAIAVGAMLLAPPAGRSAIAALAMWIKLTPGAFVVGAFVDRSSRLFAVTTTLAILGLSIALAPAAWADWIVVFPTVSGFFGGVPYTSNLAPSHVLSSTGFPVLATIAAFVVPAAFMVGVLLAAFRGQVAGWVAAGVGVYLSATGTSWDHYFAALGPIAMAAWPDAPRGLRIAIVGVLVWLGPLRFLETEPAYQLIGLGLWVTFLTGAIIHLSGGAAAWRHHPFLARLTPPVGGSD